MEGRKIECMKTGNPVGFELDTNYQLQSKKILVVFGKTFRSIIGTGKSTILTDAKEKHMLYRRSHIHNTGKISGTAHLRCLLSWPYLNCW